MSLFLFSFSLLVGLDCDVFGRVLDAGREVFSDNFLVLII